MTNELVDKDYQSTATERPSPVHVIAATPSTCFVRINQRLPARHRIQEIYADAASTGCLQVEFGAVALRRIGRKSSLSGGS